MKLFFSIFFSLSAKKKMSAIKEDYQIDLNNVFKNFFDRIFTKMFESCLDKTFANLNKDNKEINSENFTEEFEVLMHRTMLEKMKVLEEMLQKLVN